MHSTSASFPVIALAVIGIIATGLLLLCYYIFVIKCCLYWHRLDITHGVSSPHADRAPPSRGLDEAVIRSIPVVKYTESMAKDCAVCLSEFREGERLRVIPNCEHVFHIDCVDVWLQNSRNCPLCRASLSRVPRVFPLHLLNQIDGGGWQERVVSTETGGRKKLKGSMGDECIDTGRRDEEFGVQPMRRSISFDSYGDLQHVREILNRRQQRDPIGGSRSRRSFFTLSASRGSRNSVLPVFFDPS